MVHDPMPVVDLFVPLSKLVIEVDGPSHEVLTFITDANEEMRLKVIWGRDYDVATEEIYKALKYSHVRIHYSVFKLKGIELEKKLDKILGPYLK